MSQEYQLTINDYFSIAKRRGFLMLAVFSSVFVLSAILAIFLPPVYESTGTILIESSQIPTEMVQSTVTSYADERIEVIKQRVMTRENLLRILNKYNLYEQGPSITPSDLIDKMRLAITIDLVSANVPASRAKQSATIAFKVSFEHRQPELAHRVANELVTLFLDENVKVRTEKANQTTEFLTQEADKLKAELDLLEDQIAKYRQEHGNFTPENVGVTLSMMQRLEMDLREIERDQKAAEEQLRFLNIELESARAGSSAALAAGTVLTPLQEYQKTKSDLARLESVYRESHPDVRAARRKLQSLEAQLGPQEVAKDGEHGDFSVAKAEAKISAVNARISSFAQQKAALKARLAQLEKDFVQAPQVERGLSSLVRDQKNAQRKYEEIRAKQMTAQVAENLEGDKKAERFSLLDPPVAPERPIKPNRGKIVAVGFFVGLAVALGVVMLLEQIHARVRGADALESIIKRRPLAVIPFIVLESETRKKQQLIKRVALVLLLVFLLLIAMVHFLVIPLDMAWVKLLIKLN